MAEYDQYTWIFALGTICSFVCAFGIGANDVANSFASSVGAKAITVFQACLIAAVCEFSGAVGLGAGVTSTIKSGIAKLPYFSATPDLLMYGFLCVMITAAFWDNLACHLEMPVSTTHTTVGAIVGMSMAIRGKDAVVWYDYSADYDFPYIKGMVAILLSWVFSPVFAGIGVLIIFGSLRTFVLRSQHSFKRAFYLLPALVAIMFFVIILFIIQTGNKNSSWNEQIEDGKACYIAAPIGVALGLVTLVALMPYLSRLANDDETAQKELEEGKAKPLSDLDMANTTDNSGSWWEERTKSFNEWADNTPVGRALFRNSVAKAIIYGSSYDVHDSVETDESVFKVWEHAEVFDYKTERLFRYLQVFSAMVMSFAHGANDVANAVGPYAAVYYIWSEGSTPTSKTAVPKWIYVMGGAGIVLGLATYGYHIMRVLGVKVAKLTNTRGFSAELATATVVLVASRYGLPISTTQTITGAILAIGLFEGAKGVNWKMITWTGLGWVLTLLIAGLVSAGLTAFGVYAPNKLAADNILAVNKVLYSEVLSILNELNATQAAAVAPLFQTLKMLNASDKVYLNAAYKNPMTLATLQQSSFALYNSSTSLPL